ncbi:MAG: ABC transporter substrate-binding protein [Pseudomonadota bacterium]
MADFTRWIALAATACIAALSAAPIQAAETVDAAVAIIRVEREAPLPLSRLDIPAEDDGFAGGRIGLDDNNTTGRFLGHVYTLREETTAPEGVAALAEALAADDVKVWIVDAPAEALLTLADSAAASGAILFNATAPDDRLRGEACRANLFHVAPSRAMLADGVAQYMIWKKWTEWALVEGSHPEDKLLADAYRRAARKFGAKIIDELVFEDTGGARRSDSGHVLVQRQMPVFMQDADDHDVVIAADESGVFGEYLPYRGWTARPVAGSAGLEARSWHPAHEAYGATQVQRRFERSAGRRMSDVDYGVWLSMRAVGEAVTRTASADPAVLRDYLLSEDFEIAGFKGQALDFRPWNNQLRQGILLAGGKLVVSISPQEGFLHQKKQLDTLGYDEPESDCAF